MRLPAYGATMILLAVLAAGCGGGGGKSAETSASGCRVVERPAPREPKAPGGTPAALDPKLTHRAVVETNCGSFTITLAPGTSPKATASFVALAKAGYFDDTIFHRIVPDFVIQGGDPTQTGGGGPGYWMRDVPPRNARYTKGTVAMAKTGDDPPGLAGSQFFVVTAGDAGLQPVYAIVGKVTQGMDVVERIGSLGDQSEQPTQTVLIRKILVVEHPK